MQSPSADFERQLELFRTEEQSALQFFYAWDAAHTMAAKDKAVFRLLNEAPLFWNTALGAMQAATLVALGRVFDPNSGNHSLTRLLALAHANLDIFSKAALAARKRKLSPNADEWLPTYLDTVYVPTQEDFRKLKRYVAIRRKTYEEKYRPLRHEVFAHRAVTTPAQVDELFAKIDLREMRQLLVFLESIYEVLWQLYFNGLRPALRPTRYSVQSMLDRPSPNVKNMNLQERLVHETESFLVRHSRDR